MKIKKNRKSNGEKYRLMLITHDLAIGGLQQVVVNICRTINRDKYDVFVLCLRDMGEFVPEIEALGIEIIFLPQKKDGTDYFSFLKVAKILRRKKIDIIHTHNTQPFVDGTIGSLLTKVKKIVHTDHARSFPDKKRYMFAEWLMSLFAYKVVGVSEHTSENLKKYEHISSRKITTIPNGIDGEKFDISIDKKNKRRELGIRETGPVIGLGVRLAEQKGITYLLKAMPDVIKSFSDISLVIAGKGELEEKLKQEAAELGVLSNVFFVGPRLDMHELMQLFDLYVLPSLWEGLPMVVLEAMAASCPILATNVGGNSSVIKHGYNGSLIQSEDSLELSNEIIKLLSDEQLLQKYAVRSLEFFNKKYSAAIMTEKYENLYSL